MNYNSLVNQEIKDRFVSREVYANISNIAEFILQQDSSNAPFAYDDFSNIVTMVCPDCGEGLDDADPDQLYCEDCRMAAESGEVGGECPHCGGELIKPYDDCYICECGKVCEAHERDEEHAEVYEWYIVSPRLAYQLEKRGQVVLNSNWGPCIWGRRTTGQAILLDCVISEICKDMEILEGQPYSWAPTTTSVA